MRGGEERARVVRKSIAYVTRTGRVLFFRARELPSAGAELPGGTLEADEAPEAGLLREIEEETGLRDFAPPLLLGIVDFDRPDLGELHRRHFFHLTLLSDAPESWSRVVEEGNGTFTFDFFWVRASGAPDDVHPGHDQFLRAVARIVGTE